MEYLNVSHEDDKDSYGGESICENISNDRGSDDADEYVSVSDTECGKDSDRSFIASMYDREESVAKALGPTHKEIM